jgi:hypothetical protein
MFAVAGLVEPGPGSATGRQRSETSHAGGILETTDLGYGFAVRVRLILHSTTMLVHSVYFWLKPELTAAQRADFRCGVESLAAIKAVERLYVGTPAATERRPAVDRSYSVALTAILRDVAAQNAYQVDPIHLAFVNTFKTFWTKVQIYDAE